MEKEMKHIYYLLLIAVGGMVGCESTKITTKTIDYLSLPDATKYYEFEHGERVQVKLININRFLYKVSADTVTSNFNTAVPAIFTTLTLPAFITGASKSPGDHSLADSSAATPASSRKEDFYSEYNVIVSTALLINHGVDIHNQAVAISKQCDKTSANIISQVKQLVVQRASDLNIGGNEIGEVANKWNALAVDQIKSADYALRRMNELLHQYSDKSYEDYQQKLSANRQRLARAQDALDAANEALKKAKGTRDAPVAEAKVREAKAAQGDAQDQVSRTKDDYDHVTKDMQDRMAEAKDLLANIHKISDDGKIYSLFDDLKRINTSSYEYYAPLIPMKRDEAKVTFTVTADPLLTCPKPNEQKFAVTLRTKGGIKIDFSTGLFINAGNPDFLGKDYYYKPVTDSLSTISYANAGKKALVSIGALMHIYRRSSAPIKLAGSIGASLNTGATVVNLHVGPSLIIGNKNRLVLSTGLTLRESKVLDKAYSEGAQYPAALLPEAVPTVTKFPLAGYFFSLTYNLSSLGN
ncbi:MAG: hypothetical protein JST68_21555 [Bacteroidetes bacterium]|nr:hypothetical protein [Bacteroidota bacterium]